MSVRIAINPTVLSDAPNTTMLISPNANSAKQPSVAPGLGAGFGVTA